jgi:hypothetical protein
LAIDSENVIVTHLFRYVVKYTGTDTNSYAEEMLKWARDGGMSVIELTPLRFGAFGY